MYLFVLKILVGNRATGFSGRVSSTSINDTSCHDGYTRDFPECCSGALQNPVASNKQVVKLGMHLLLRAGNKAIKLRDTPAAMTYAYARIKCVSCTYARLCPLYEKRFPSSSGNEILLISALNVITADMKAERKANAQLPSTVNGRLFSPHV